MCHFGVIVYLNIMVIAVVKLVSTWFLNSELSTCYDCFYNHSILICQLILVYLFNKINYHFEVLFLILKQIILAISVSCCAWLYSK